MIDFNDAFERQASPTETALERERERLTQRIETLERRRRWVIWGLVPSWAAGLTVLAAVLHSLATETRAGPLVFAILIWVGVPAVMGICLVDKHLVEKPLKAAQAALDKLVSLDAESSPDECIRLDAWREQDETVAAYLAALAGLGRKPVVGEYLAAKAWMEDAEGRSQKAEKMERARQACARFAL